MNKSAHSIAPDLNTRASSLVDRVLQQAQELRIDAREAPSGGRVIDFGAEVEGSVAAGLALSSICLADLAAVSLVLGELDGSGWPEVVVRTDHPLEACLFSQYAGWQIATDDYIAMGSGPMRAAAAREDLFGKLGYREHAEHIVGVLESRKLPTASAIGLIAEKSGVVPEQVTLLVAPTSSLAGNVQVVARSVETALHKLFELEFDVRQVRSGFGSAPLPPVAGDDLTGIGRTNDAILYGGSVTLWVDCSDDAVEAVGPQVPASAASCYGMPFLRIFEEAGCDFYKIDPHLFSPAEIVFHNIRTGCALRFGQRAPDILRESFGV
jgi:methenyltetrahydromethanopterin cyclohydrolase